jgi:hypothetical protein
MLNNGYNDLWPTKVYVGNMENKDLVEELIQDLLVMPYDEIVGEGQKNNILNLEIPVIQNFKNKVIIPSFEKYLNDVCNCSLQEYSDFKLKGWITSYKKDYEVYLHNHSGSEFSAVFYLMAEEETSGGEIVFIDPRHNANRGYDLNLKKSFVPISHLPKTGQLLIFPSFLYHWVNSYSSQMRIAMPVDIFLGPYKSK